LVHHHESYLSGYLAVRKIVAAWRRELGEPLSATQAARILLHVTTNGSQEAIPSLDLPLDDCSAAALAAHTSWVQGLSKLAANDLRKALVGAGEDGAAVSARWVGGRFVEHESLDVKAVDEEILDYTVRRIAEARRGVFQERPQAFPSEPSDLSPTLSSQVASAFREHGRFDQRFDRLALIDLVRQLSALPVAQVHARFWLNRAERAVFCLIRTSEKGGAQEQPAYNGLLFILESKEFDELLGRVQASGNFRIAVTRMADLAPAMILEQRGHGRNCVAFHYGDWLHVQMRGLLSGAQSVASALVDVVRARCVGSPITTFDQGVLGDGTMFARNVAQWIDEDAPWTIDGQPLPLTAWLKAVRGLCEEVARGQDDTGELTMRVSRKLLSDIVQLSPDAVDRVSTSGLRGLASIGTLGAVIDAIHRSADRPIDDSSVLDLCNGLFARSVLGLDVSPLSAGA
jgi:hypothetical protein